MDKMEKAVITVIGKDMVGILAKVSGICAEKGVNVLEVTQSILQDMFVMVMLVDITHASVAVADLADEFDQLGGKLQFEDPRDARGHFQFHAQNLTRLPKTP